MDTGQKVAIGILAGLAAVGLGIGAYDEYEKSKCEKSGGTWQGLFKGCTPSVNQAQLNCQDSGGTWNASTGTCTCPSGYTLDSSGRCVSSTPSPSPSPSPSAPGQVDPSTINISWQTPTSAQSVTGTLSWGAVSGATSYQVSLNGGSPETVNGTSVQISAAPGSSIQISIAACS